MKAGTLTLVWEERELGGVVIGRKTLRAEEGVYIIQTVSYVHNSLTRVLTFTPECLKPGLGYQSSPPTLVEGIWQQTSALEGEAADLGLGGARAWTRSHQAKTASS